MKNSSESLSGALEIIFGKSLVEGDVPNEWREANVTPLFKKGSKLTASNYSPVSLTSICCKIMEGIIRDRITSHLIRHKLISSSQHGFVHKKSCITNLLRRSVRQESMNTDRNHGGDGFTIPYLSLFVSEFNQFYLA